mmetsp:Transcript_31388/g.91643  ORF Transcript_31388/g.91643 Transcript_31388/m.91643 type:complete len:135 (+) Transcript_31388:119-523(+)
MQALSHISRRRRTAKGGYSLACAPFAACKKRRCKRMQQPGDTGAKVINAAGNEVKATMTETIVTVKHIAPSLWNRVKLQKTRKKAAPAVVAALPRTAPPKDFMANIVRCILTLAACEPNSGEGSRFNASLLEYL